MKNMKVLAEEIRQGRHDEILKDIYVDESVLEYQRKRYIKAIEEFENIFGESDVEIYSAPGRCEVGGNQDRKSVV